MFESRLQAAQLCLAGATVLLGVAGLVLWLGPLPVGVFLLVAQAAAAAVGCYLYADAKAYPGWLGIALGVGLGPMGALLLLILPDQTEDVYLARQRRLTREGLKPSRRKDPGYEVLDDGPSPYD